MFDNQIVTKINSLIEIEFNENIFYAHLNVLTKI